MKGLWKWLGLLAGLPVVAIALFYFWGSAGTLDRQKYAEIVNYGTDGGANRDATAQESYTIVSYNIGYLSGLTNNTTTQPERAFFDQNQTRAIAALQAVNPDIVAFQEIDLNSKRSYGVNQLEAMAQGLGLGSGALAINWDKNYLPFPYWPPSAHFGKILSGQAILSRHPIEKNSRTVLAKVAGNNFIYNAFYLDRLAQVSQITLNGKTLMVINLHLEAFDAPTRIAQTTFVRSLAEKYAQTYPVIVLGDFNSSLNRTEEAQREAPKFSIEIMANAEQFTAAVPQPQWGEATATFPANQPRYKLDYIFYTPSTLELLNSQVIKSAGESSDHLPLMATFRFKEP